MKNILIITLTLFCASCFTSNASAQSAASDEALLIKWWNNVWQAYEDGNEAKMWAAYADNACEVYPDGNSACGLKAIKEGYEMFKGMLESAPKWSYTTPTVQFFEPNVALLIADITSDIKLKGGQQIGGKTKFAAIVHKVNGQWLIVFDSQTPVMQMPGGGN